MMDYTKACEVASEDQGIAKIQSELTKLGIESFSDQTGGFTMVGRVVIDDGSGKNEYPYLGFTSECIVLYRDDDSEGVEVMAEFPVEWEGGKLVSYPSGIAQTIETILAHYSFTRANEDGYMCAQCQDEPFFIWQGRIAVQSETFVEFYCSKCATQSDIITRVTV